MEHFEPPRLSLDPEEWCERFVAAWTAQGISSTKPPWAEAEAAYETSCMLEPERAAAMMAERRASR
jgi:hypothetical protein